MDTLHAYIPLAWAGSSIKRGEAWAALVLCIEHRAHRGERLIEEWVFGTKHDH
jgi:hypothetical protein